MLDGVAEAMQRADPGVAAIGEHEPAGGAHPDHLVVEHVRRHPDQLEVAATLPQQLMAGREGDQVRETLERHAVAIRDELADGLVERYQLSHSVRNANT